MREGSWDKVVIIFAGRKKKTVGHKKREDASEPSRWELAPRLARAPILPRRNPRHTCFPMTPGYIERTQGVDASDLALMLTG